MPVVMRNGVAVATKNPKKKPVWEMTKAEQMSGPVVFDFDELLEFAEGDIAPVFGPDFKIIDTYPRRVRLPASEYLLCSRVTKMDAEPNVFRVGASMVTEYDLPINGELSLGGDIPWAILVESGQCDLMLISYMGIDFQCYGKRVYRLLDTTLTFFGVASEGETLVYDIRVKGFAKGNHGEVSMFFFEYDCYCNGKLLIEMRNGSAGFFSNEELAAGKGAVRTVAELKFRADKQSETDAAKKSKGSVNSLMIKPAWHKTKFNESDMQSLVNKQWAKVLGDGYALDYRLTTPKMLMIDRVTHIDPVGGIYGLGLIVGEKILDPKHWYFPCHFVKDQVMAGSLVSDGCSQLVKLYFVWLGLMDAMETGFQFRPVDGQPNKVRCRGQISPHKGKLVYVMEVKELGFDQNNCPYAIADVDIIDVDTDQGQTFEWSTKEELVQKLDGYGRGDLSKKIVVDFKGLALKMQGKRKAVIGPNGVHKSNFIQPPVGCLISDANPPKEMTWHPLYPVLQNAHAKNPSIPVFSFYPSKFPPRAVTYWPFLKNGKAIGDVKPTDELSTILNEIDLNFTPGQYPLNFYNMCEFMCGHVSNCLGDECSIFDVSKTSRSPAFDLQLVTRVINWTGIIPKNVYGVDVDPSVGQMIAEFDCPKDAWFFDAFPSNDSTSYSHVPYSILMEIALQTSGILTSVLKAPLTMKKKDILFRNLDAKSELFDVIKGIDLRGKTLINKSWCNGYNMLGNMGVHRFTFELYLKETPNEACNGNLDNYIKNYETENIAKNKLGCIYRGETSFGWFVPEVFENQVGLDNGKKMVPKFQSDAKLGPVCKKFSDIHTQSGRNTFVGTDSIKSSLLRKTSQSEFLDEIDISESDAIDLQYVHGKKTVDTSDWFFSCHFWNDPVMPGSLGVESMFQLLEYYAIHKQLFNKLASGKDYMFRHVAGKTAWKYRGQLTPKNKQMDSEIFVKSVELVDIGEGNKGIEITADGNLFVDQLRVYEVKDIRIQLIPYVAKKTPNGSAVMSNGNGTANKMRLHSLPNNKLSFDSYSLSNGNGSAASKTEISIEQLRTKLLEINTLLNLSTSNDKIYTQSNATASSGTIFPVEIADLGDKSFMRLYGVDANMYTGAMAKGIASADLVITMGKNNILGSFGAGGLPMHVVERNIIRIKEELGNKPFAVNLIHSPFDPNLEEGAVELFKKHNVNIVEASAFMNLTPSVVLYRASGLSISGNEITIGNKLIAKCSRTEVASMFLDPAPIRLLDGLLSTGKITKEQYDLAQLVPMADDVAIEADSGGHTDNRQIQVVLPLVIALRNRMFAAQKALFAGKSYKLSSFAYNKASQKHEKIMIDWPLRPRIGGGGGIGCPEGAMATYSLGAAFIITGTINQMCRESGTCDIVRQYLSEASYADVTMAPAADMFEQGVELQVLKKGTMFPSRAKKLYDLFSKYNSFDEMPAEEISNLERRILKKPIPEVWEETKDFYINRLKNPAKIDKVEKEGDLKLKMSLCFRWYLGLSSFWANSGDESRKTDYQIWCGPAIGAFNQFIAGSSLDPKVAGCFPTAIHANMEILKGAAYLSRVNQIKFNRNIQLDVVDTDLATYVPK